MGSVVISIDAELGWGFIDFDAPPTDRVECARDGWQHLCDRLEAYDIPATWAIVGHVFHEECDGNHRSHPAWPEWFDRESGPWADRPDLICGADLVRRLRASSVAHDIGGHSYAHMEFGADATNREMAAHELAKSVAVADRWGVDLQSFVFPRNNVGHTELLAEHGFRTYRGVRPGPARDVPKRLLASVRKGARPPLVTPTVDEHGLVNTPASLFLYGFEGLPLRATRLAGHDPIVTLARRGVEAAAREDGVFHCWLHPNNLIGTRQRQRLERVLAAIDEHRDELRVETMAEVADRVLESEPETAALATEE